MTELSTALRRIDHTLTVWLDHALYDRVRVWMTNQRKRNDSIPYVLGTLVDMGLSAHVTTRALLAALDEEEGNRDGALVLPPDPRCSACTASGTVPTTPCARHAAALLVQYPPFDPAGGRDG
jgi:hypothetical protein